MIKELFALASEFETQALRKTAGKERLSRGKISKQLEKAKADYANLKKSLDVLEANDAKLKGQLEDTRKSTNDARSRILKMHKAMQNMDLANANDAIFYGDNQDVGYVIEGKEYHLDINDVGEVTLTPMNKHRKAMKQPKLEEQQAEDMHCAEDCEEEEHGHDKKEDGEEEDFDDLYASLVE